MIIETRYRDIPFEEVQGGFSADVVEQAREVWPTLRGRAIRIHAPALTLVAERPCGGPFYEIIEASTWPYLACPHIAEIGD